jgi:hypothetical protein
MTISPSMKVKTNDVRGRIGRVSLDIQVLGCIPDGVKYFFEYVYLG